jgi:hypothetical protein
MRKGTQIFKYMHQHADVHVCERTSNRMSSLIKPAGLSIFEEQDSTGYIS